VGIGLDIGVIFKKIFFLIESYVETINLKRKRDMKKILSLSATIFIAGSLLPASLIADEQESFDLGIKTALKIVKHEKEQRYKPIPKGYCIKLSPEIIDNQKSFVAVKAESLSMYFGLSPQYIKAKVDDTTKAMVCMTIEPTKEEAIKVLKNVEEEYPDIKIMTPTLVRIMNPKEFQRVLPGIGNVVSSEIDECKLKIKSAKKEYEAETKKLRSTIEKMKKEIAEKKKTKKKAKSKLKKKKHDTKSKKQTRTVKSNNSKLIFVEQ